MKNTLFFFGVLSSFVFLSCSKHTPTDSGGEPTPPKWVEVSVFVDSLSSSDKSVIMKFTVVATGDSGELVKINDGRDTLNYLWISLHPDSSIVLGSTKWEGKVKYLDTIRLTNTFTPLKTSFIYTDYSTGKLREFDWKVDLWVEYGYYDSSGILQAFHTLQGYSTTYLNTETGDSFTKINAVTNN